MGLTLWGVSSGCGVNVVPAAVVAGWSIGRVPDLVIGSLATLFLFLFLRWHGLEGDWLAEKLAEGQPMPQLVVLLGTIPAIEFGGIGVFAIGASTGMCIARL